MTFVKELRFNIQLDKGEFRGIQVFVTRASLWFDGSVKIIKLLLFQLNHHISVTSHRSPVRGEQMSPQSSPDRLQERFGVMKYNQENK